MCRINGIVDPGLKTAERLQWAIAMRDSMTHGGPDDAGVISAPHSPVVLANRRLALLDLSSDGHQPMQTEDRKISITFNGEIYNFREIRSQLEQLGCEFRSQTDTEVILRAYRQWGEDAFSKFNGMFAFAIQDDEKQLLYLVRDPAGIKPLYYALQDGALLFASELRAFGKIPSLREENPDWPVYFLSFGYIPEPFTLLNKVKMLPRGCFIRYQFDSRKHEVKKYFDYHFEEIITDPEQALHRVRTVLGQAVKRHLIADAPVGIFLSGGIDSSLLALLASQAGEQLVKTLSITFGESQFSEQPYQQLIVNLLRSEHQSSEVNQSMFINSLPDIFSAMDQPTTDGINTYFISHFARVAGFKAVLSGLGADELFGGYPSFHDYPAQPLMQWMPRTLFKTAGWLKSEKFKKISFLALPDDLGNHLLFRGLFSPSTVASLLDISPGEVNQKLQELFLGKLTANLSPGNKASWMELSLYMQNQLLRDSDTMSMWHSVELRVPFLDKELMQLVMQLKSSLKFSAARPKDLLIRAFEDILPRQIWDRPKQGFTFPFQQWMGKEERVKQLHHHRHPLIRQMAKEFDHNQIQWSRVWALVLLQEWKGRQM